MELPAKYGGVGMSYLHRNSQKRIHKEGAQYFITSVTFDRYPYFKDPILAELFIQDLWFTNEMNDFELFGYTLLPDHVHLLIQPRGGQDYSDIMGALKRNVARDANDILRNRPFIRNLLAGDDSNRRLRTNFEKTLAHHPSLSFECYVRDFITLRRLNEEFWERNIARPAIPTFRWQKSFRDHFIRGEKDFLHHLEYIYFNAVKHGIVSNPAQYRFVWIQGMPGPFAPD